MQAGSARTAAAIALAVFFAGAASAADLPRQSVDKAGRASWRQALHWPDDCEEGFDYGDDMGGIEVMEVAPHQWVVEVVCTLGAYQGYQNYFAFDETQHPPVARPLALRVYGEDGFTTTAEIWGRPELDPVKKELVLTNVFRGPGDCGVRSRYRFANGDAQLVEVRAKRACDGKWIEPEQWPIVKIP